MTSCEAKPIARMKDLISTELSSGEIVIFDKERNKAHSLNPAAAAIWKACDGQRSVADLTALVAVATGASSDEAVVWMSVKELQRLHLVEELPASVFPLEVLTRRQAMARVGSTAATAAALVPIIATVLAPKPAAASSCQQPGSPCTVGSQCCSGTCAGNVCT